MHTLYIQILLLSTCYVSMERIQGYNQIGMTFMKQFYAIYDNDSSRTNLRDLYDTNDSILVYHGEIFYGLDKIITKYTNLAKVVERNITTADFQPTNDAGVILNIFGRIMLKDATNKSYYSEMFVIKPRVTAYYIQHHHFRFSGIWAQQGNNSDGLIFV